MINKLPKTTTSQNSSNNSMEPSNLNYSQLISDLRSLKLPSNEQIASILSQAKSIISKEPNVLTIDPPLVVVGNVFGHFHDLLEDRCKEVNQVRPTSIFSLETMLIKDNTQLKLSSYFSSTSSDSLTLSSC